MKNSYAEPTRLLRQPRLVFGNLFPLLNYCSQQLEHVLKLQIFKHSESRMGDVHTFITKTNMLAACIS